MRYQTREDQDAVILSPVAGPPDASVLWLHGLGADGHDFAPLIPLIELPPQLRIRFVLPHAPVRAVSLNQGLQMRAWYDIKALSDGAPEDAAGIAESGARVEAYIQREREQGIPAQRIVLARDRLACEASEANQHTPILMCHGRDDPVLTFQIGEMSRDALLRLGYAVQWREYRMRHEVCPAEIADIATWLQQVFA